MLRIRDGKADASDLDVLRKMKREVESEFARRSPEEKEQQRAAKDLAMDMLNKMENHLKIKLGLSVASASSGQIHRSCSVRARALIVDSLAFWLVCP